MICHNESNGLLAAIDGPNDVFGGHLQFHFWKPLHFAFDLMKMWMRNPEKCICRKDSSVLKIKF
jgi:hypothetical protein